MPIVEIEEVDRAVPLLKPKQGGIDILSSFTDRSQLRGDFAYTKGGAGRPCVGAGTVTSLEKFHAAVDAAATLSSLRTDTIAQAGADSLLPVLPGVSCATDIMLGQEYGYRAFKFFLRRLLVASQR